MTRDDAIEVIVMSAVTTETKSSGKTRKVTFLLPNEGEHPFSGLIGERIHIVCIRLNNDETPITDKVVPTLGVADRAAAESDEDGRKRRFYEMSPAAQIAMSCSSPSFREYLRTFKDSSLPDDAAACDAYVKGLLGIKSKTEVQPGTESFAAWTELRGSYDVWLRYERQPGGAA